LNSGVPNKNIAARLMSNILASHKFMGWLRYWLELAKLQKIENVHEVQKKTCCSC